MDTSEYIRMFLAESREHLQKLNLAIIRIEETPSDSETIDEIFRIAHSLKGMSAHDGLRPHGGAHARDGGRLRAAAPAAPAASSGACIDILLECLDALEGAVEAIETNGDENLDPTTLIARLSELIRDRTSRPQPSPRRPLPPPDCPPRSPRSPPTSPSCTSRSPSSPT